MPDSRPKVLITNLMMLRERERFDAEVRARGYDPIWVEVDQYLDEGRCCELVGSIDGWLAGDDQITAAVLDKALPRLKVIAKWGTGIDSIDRDAAAQRGIPVLNSPGAFSDAVAECAIGLVLMLSRHLLAIDNAIRAGEWPKPQGRELRGATLAMVGYGAIGCRIAELGEAFGMRVVFHDPFVEGSQDLAEIAQQADVLCLACALTPENRHIINREILALMPRGALLVNVARGPLMDEAAVIDALRHGHLGGAGLDVFEEEPLPMDSSLRALPNVVLSSHNANNGLCAVEAVHARTLDNLVSVLG